jgi:hypothetical protein
MVRNLGKAAKKIFIVAIPIVFIVGALMALYNTNPTGYLAIIQGLTGQFPISAEHDLYDRLHSVNGAKNLNYFVTSSHHASSPARHWNPLVNKAIDMWCVVVNPPSEIRVIDDGDRQLRSFLVYKTKQDGRWQVTDGIAVFQSTQEDFESVGCTNYQN